MIDKRVVIDKNIYYSPEAFGLRTVGEVDFSSGSYEFDMTVVWQDEGTGALYYADDSGCSCPAPFECHDRSTITRIERPQELIDHLDRRKQDSYYYDVEWNADAAASIDAACAELILRAGQAAHDNREGWEA